jgi:hypothetical protein
MNITRAGLCVSQLTSIAGSDWVNLPETVPRSRPVSGPYRDLDVECETHIGGPWNDWVRLKYEMTEYYRRTARDRRQDFLATSRPPFGGLRWWFVCPQLNRRVRKLYLPLGGRHFWSRRAYELAYASQRETKYSRALRRARKLRLRLGGEPTDDEYPDKPPRMRWATYNRLLDKLRAADGVAETKACTHKRADVGFWGLSAYGSHRPRDGSVVSSLHCMNGPTGGCVSIEKADTFASCAGDHCRHLIT